MDTNRNCRIERIEIVSFGKLHQFVLELGEGLHLLNAPNESGKSTLAAFLRFVFYGFADARKKELAENDKKLYTPWDTPRSEGSVQVRKGDLCYRVTRTCVAGGKETCFVAELSTGREVFQGEVPGIVLFGVTEEVFSRTLFFRQLTLPQGKDKDGVLAEQLQNLAVSADEQVSSRRAEERLMKARNELKGRAGAGWIPKLEQESARLDSELAAAVRERDEIGQLRADQEISKGRLAENRLACDRVEAELKNWDRYDAERNLRQLHRLQQEAARAKAAYEAADRPLCRAETQEVLTGLLSKNAELEAARARAKATELSLQRAVSGTPASDGFDAEGADRALRASRKPALFLIVTGLVTAVGGGCSLLFSPAAGQMGWLLSGALLFLLSAVLFFAAWGSRRRLGRKAAGRFGAVDVKALQERIRLEPERRKQREETFRVKKEELQAAAQRESEEAARLQSEMEAGIRSLHVSPREPFSLQLQELLASCGEAARLRAAYESADRACRIAEEGIDLPALTALAEGASEPTRERAAAERELTFLRKQRQMLTEKERQQGDRIASLEGKSADPAVLAGKREAVVRKLEECHVRYEAYEAARAGIEEAADRMKSMVAPRISAAAGAYFSAASGGKYRDLRADTRLALTARDGGIDRECDYLSAGTRDCAYLSLRLALTDLLFGGAGMPMILDDAFGRLDDSRLEHTLRLLGAAAEKHQLLLLCCTDREQRALERVGVPYRLLHALESETVMLG